MGYEVHIEREDRSEISLAEWTAAIEAAEGMRLATKDATATNPMTGERIVMPRMDGDVEVYLPEVDEWIHCLRYSPRRISFRPPDDFDDPSSAFRRATAELASKLKARVVGDEGEIYT